MFKNSMSMVKAKIKKYFHVSLAFPGSVAHAVLKVEMDINLIISLEAEG